MKRIILFFSALLVISFGQSCTNEVSPVQQTPQLTTSETEDLLFLYEEEKMARDLYQYANDLYDVMQFSKISDSEQQHMYHVSTILDTYKVPYPADYPSGSFQNDDVQALYDLLKARMDESLEEALRTAAYVEETDIADIRIFYNRTDKEDVRSMLESLECASGNHIRAFISKLETLGLEYDPEILLIEDLNEILAQSQTHCH